MAFLATALGTSYIEEQVFEGSFATAKILEQMGAVIRTENQRAVIEGQGLLPAIRNYKAW